MEGDEWTIEFYVVKKRREREEEEEEEAFTWVGRRGIRGVHTTKRGE